MYLLDTNTCIFIINHNPPTARARFEAVALPDIAISSITLFELDAGARKGTKSNANLIRLEQFAATINVLAFDATAARKAGELRQHLRERGTPIGDMDTLIAAHALAVGATVVTNNLGEFSRVPGLVLEDWLSG
jgi:tRNA(fMet)-specific endonuclease VapC